jgi:DNA-binding GntR family transcriptional regulator
VSFALPTTVLGEKTSVAAARILRQAILAGELAPGQVLGEESLAKQLGISRTPIREALLRLHSEGLVEMPPNRPAAVQSFDQTTSSRCTRCAPCSRATPPRMRRRT